jgi:hypothetical protein
MTLAALIAWVTTAGGGLYLLTIWLIEYDREFQSAAATRLPVPVIGLHALLAIIGLGVWTFYLITDRPGLTWVAVLILLAVVGLGLSMAVRWIAVYREHTPVPAHRAAASRAAMAMAADGPAELRAPGSGIAPPPERSFPVPVVVAHGIFATATLILVLLTALRMGGS